MKKGIVLAICILATLTGYGQEQSFKKNEIGLRLISLSQNSKDYTYFNHKSNRSPFFNSLTYRRIFNSKNAVRLILYSPIKRTKKIESGDVLVENQFRENMIKVGYQYTLNMNKWSPYFGVDAFYRMSETRESWGGGIIYSYGNSNMTSENIGISPHIGLNYFIGSNFIVEFETSIDLAHKTENITVDSFSSYPNNSNADIIIANTKKLEYIWNIISASIKYQF